MLDWVPDCVSLVCIWRMICGLVLRCRYGGTSVLLPSKIYERLTPSSPGLAGRLAWFGDFISSLT